MRHSRGIAGIGKAEVPEGRMKKNVKKISNGRNEKQLCVILR